MDSSDDPFITPQVIGAAALGVGVTALSGGFSGRGGDGVVQAGQAQRTAEPTVQLSEAAKRNRRLAASSLTKGFAEPTLGVPGLLGA